MTSRQTDDYRLSYFWPSSIRTFRTRKRKNSAREQNFENSTPMLITDFLRYS